MFNMRSVESTIIRAIGYSPESHRLIVELRPPGETYIYDGVNASVYDAFLNSESKGRFFNEHVRSVYPHVRA
jgi:hypothetical protein